MLVKCKACDNKIERNNAYKIVKDGKNNYYCNEEEYTNWLNKQSEKDNTYKEIYDIFGRKITNTILYKEINELVQVYGYTKLLCYLTDKHAYLESVMAKSFVSEYVQIRYFTAILKNSLADFKIDNKEINIQVNVDIPKDNYKMKQRKKSLSEYEMEVGD